MTPTILITSIIVTERQRTDLGDLSSLMDSIRTYGVIQPIVLNQENRLIAGQRRLRACQALGMTEIPYVLRESLDEAELAELEFEEDVRRKDRTWQEKCLAVAKIHAYRKRNAVLASEDWGLRDTGELLEMDIATISHAIHIASALLTGDTEVATQPNMFNAFQVLLSRKAKEVEKDILSVKVIKQTAEGQQDVFTSTTDPLPLEPEDGEYRSMFRRPLVEFLQTNPELTGKYRHLLEGSVSVELVNGDCLEWLASRPDASIDHIYTDPPYAIDMDNIQQDGGGMDVELVKDTHQVNENLVLLDKFISSIYRVLKPTAFLVFWCDQDNWGALKELATFSGFRVMRWPLTWCKSDVCQNMQANKNFTKSTEIAMLCAMPDAVLYETRPSNFIVASNDKKTYAVTNPFWKPLVVHKWILKAIAPIGATIVDPFAGCGSIPLACISNGYNIIAVEKDPTHFVQMQRILS
jgi:ParB family chromosome partitioning protein